MVQVVQIKRRVTGPGNPPTLAPGELAYNSTGNLLVIGDATSTVQNLVSPARQVEVTGDQTIAGNKTIPVANLKLTGGVADDVLQTDGAGNLAWVAAPPPMPATDAEMDAGTLNNVFGTPLNTRSLIGASVGTLTTIAKTVVPSINELKAAIDLLAIGHDFVGYFDATANTITWTTVSGGAGNVLPAPGPANHGWYIIASVAGPGPIVGAPGGYYEVGDWLLSNGAVWTHLPFGGIAIQPASAIPVTPPVAGGDDVQSALQGLDAAIIAGDALKVAKAGDTMTGALVLPAAAPTLPEHAAHKQYVDDMVAAASVIADAISIVGDGTAALPLAVGLVDGGVY